MEASLPLRQPSSESNLPKSTVNIFLRHLGVVVRVYNSKSQETEAGGSQTQGQPELHTHTHTQNKIS
jgi:hypothetical protein